MKSLFSESFTHKKWSIIILSFIAIINISRVHNIRNDKEKCDTQPDGRETVVKNTYNHCTAVVRGTRYYVKAEDHVAPKKDTPSIQ